MHDYYYNVNSSKKVLHLFGCHYLTCSKKQEFGKKHNLEKALRKGYTLCKHCFALHKRFAFQFGNAYCKHNYFYNCDSNCLEITTAKNTWLVRYAEDKTMLELYHRNTEERVTDSLSSIPGYHCQHVRRYEVDDIIYYIFTHDGKRVLPPPKGSKRYVHYKKQQKIQARRNAINNVLNLIDSLHSVPCHTISSDTM